MEFSEIASFVETCASLPTNEIRWCDEVRFKDENLAGASPGGDLNPFGYYVIGTTIGGNAVVVGSSDSRVLFADHTWYSDDDIYYQDHAGDGAWHSLPLTQENVSKSLLELAADWESFVARIKSGDIDRLIGSID